MKASFKSTPIPAPPPIEEITIVMSKKSAQQLRRLMSYIRVTSRYAGAEPGDVGILLAGLITLPTSIKAPNTPTVEEALELLSALNQELHKLKELD